MNKVFYLAGFIEISNYLNQIIMSAFRQAQRPSTGPRACRRAVTNSAKKITLFFCKCIHYVDKLQIE